MMMMMLLMMMMMILTNRHHHPPPPTPPAPTPRTLPPTSLVGFRVLTRWLFFAGGVDAAAAEEAVAGLLSLVASVLERLEFVVCEGSSDEQHPASFLARACLPHLRTIANSDLTRNRHPVASALCKVRIFY
jgi:hypothetical protein